MTNALLGAAIGDSLGVFAESKLHNYQPLLDWDGKTYLGSEHHDLKPGEYSDDTQLSRALAESLISCNGFNPDDVSKKYVELFTSNTIRGYGKSTLFAINNLIAGKHWSESGCVGSVGNGTAMRVSPLSIWYRDDLPSLIKAVKIDSAITHVSEEAEAGALAIALSAYYAVNNDTQDLLNKIVPNLPESKVKSSLYSLGALIEAENISPQSALSILGTKCDVRQTVPAVLYCFHKFDNYQNGCETIIRAGGDTDSNASILGALYGAKYGQIHFSEYHIKNVEDSSKLITLDSQLYNRSGTSFFS